MKKPTEDEIQRVTEYLRNCEIIRFNERFEKKFNDSRTITTYQGIDLMDDRISKEAILGIIQEERILNEHRNN